MALHSNFPESSYAILDPSIRWFPADEALRESSMDKLMPPLVPQLRKKVKAWTDATGATIFNRYKPKTFRQLVDGFRGYKERDL